jgi:hypothetical protein
VKLRGLLPSLGAGGSLIGAALVAVAIVGGGLAFRGQGGDAAEANTGDLSVPGPAVGPPAPAPALSDAAAQALTLNRVGGRRPAVAGGRRPRAAAPKRRRAAAPPRATPTPGASTPAAGGSPGGGSAAKPRPASTPSPAPRAPGTVERVVKDARAVTDPVVEAVPEPVKAPVETIADTAGDTVEQVAGFVDQAVDDVTGSLLP